MSRDFTRGGKGIRTPDLLHAMETRYQLRHTPEHSIYLKVSAHGMQNHSQTKRPA